VPLTPVLWWPELVVSRITLDEGLGPGGLREFVESTGTKLIVTDAPRSTKWPPTVWERLMAEVDTFG
jgi:hypothetical protein